MQTTTIYMFGFSKETSHLDGSFEYPEEIQMVFIKIRKLTSINDISYISLESNKKNYKKQTICEPRR